MRYESGSIRQARPNHRILAISKPGQKVVNRLFNCFDSLGVSGAAYSISWSVSYNTCAWTDRERPGWRRVEQKYSRSESKKALFRGYRMSPRMSLTASMLGAAIALAFRAPSASTASI